MEERQRKKKERERERNKMTTRMDHRGRGKKRSNYPKGYRQVGMQVRSYRQIYRLMTIMIVVIIWIPTAQEHERGTLEDDIELEGSFVL